MSREPALMRLAAAGSLLAFAVYVAYPWDPTAIFGTFLAATAGWLWADYNV